jgi:hypothetical protein
MPPVPYVNTTASTESMPPHTAMLIWSAVKMFLRPLYTRYNEPDARKAMTLYMTALCGLNLFYVRHDGICSIVSSWLNTGDLLQQNYRNVLTYGSFFYTEASTESIQMLHELSPALVLFIL